MVRPWGGEPWANPGTRSVPHRANRIHLRSRTHPRNVVLMDSTLGTTPSSPVDRPGLLRPVALAGVLWLFIAGLFSLGALYALAVAPVVALFYALPIVPLAAFGFRLITRRGVGLPLLSMLLGTGLAMLGVLGIPGVNGGGSGGIGDVLAALYGGAIAASSIFGVWSARMDLPALRVGLGRRVLLALVVVGVYVGAGVLAVTFGPLRGCVPIAPHALPSGAAPGPGVEDVAGGAKQVVWGSGSDRVEQIVGLTYYWETFADDSPTLVAQATVRGQAATIYRMSPESSDRDLGFSWVEEGCDRSVFLAPGTTPEQAEGFAARY
jgi:hypothetical protein